MLTDIRPSITLTPRSYGRTETGRVRTNNEDALLANDQLGLYVVCDGMGGHDGGEVASGAAINSVSTYFHEHRDEIRESCDDSVVMEHLVSEAIRAANCEICRLSEDSDFVSSMGTTITLLLIRGEIGVMGHCGDSRLYQATNGLDLLSCDHTMEQELRRNGFKGDGIKRYGHILTRVLGRADFTGPDIETFSIEKGTRYLLCSDGLSGYLDEDTERWIDWSVDRRELLDQLVDHAGSAGGKDNITGLIIDVE